MKQLCQLKNDLKMEASAAQYNKSQYDFLH